MSWWNRENLKTYDALICDGAVRSGKTLCMVTGFFLWSMANFNGQVFALCGKTISSLRRNVTIHLPQWLGSVLEFTEHRADNRITVRCGNTQNTYYLFGGQDEGAAALIQGITLAGVLLDEVVLMPRSFVEQACARCSVSGSKMWFSCNPGSPEHWFYKEWILKAGSKNALYLHFTMEDNPSLEEKIRRRYESLYTGHFYRRFVQGQWCGAEGLVYEFDKELHIARELPQGGRYFISVDYGTLNPFSAGLWCIAEGKAFRMGEFYYNGRETGRLRTDEEYCEDILRLAGGNPIEAVIVDPSASSFITALRRRGMRVRRAKNAVVPGIGTVTKLLREGRLLIAPGCRDCIREFSQYCWEESGDNPKKENDHAMDEVRYFCHTVMGREGSAA